MVGFQESYAVAESREALSPLDYSVSRTPRFVPLNRRALVRETLRDLPVSPWPRFDRLNFRGVDKTAMAVCLLGLFMHFLLIPAILFGPYGPETVEGNRYAPEHHGAVILAFFGPMALGVLHVQQLYMIEDLSIRSAPPTHGLRNLVVLSELAYVAVIMFLCVFLQTTYFTISEQQIMITCVAVCRGLSVCGLRIILARIVSTEWITCSAFLACFS